MNRISVVIPVYNIAQYVGRCLDSILAQSYQDFECIVIDDGSKDGSGKICDDYSMRNAKIKVFHKQNEGVMKAVYDGVKMAHGNVIVFLDGDDFLENNALAEIADHMDDADILLYNYNIVFSDKVVENAICLEEGDLSKEGSPIDICIKNDVGYARWNKAIRRELLLDVYPFLNEKVGLADDITVILPVLYRAKTMRYLSKPLVNYCQNGDSYTHKYRREYLTDYKNSLINLNNFFKDTEYNRLPNEMFFRYIKFLIRLAVFCSDNCRKELKFILTDSIVKKEIAKYRANNWRNRLMQFVMKHRLYFLIKALMTFYVRRIQDWKA